MEAEVEDAVNKLAKNDSFPAVPSPSIPLREDQITNAVAFLSHTKVRDSAPSAKRSFLEGKGLTAAEIQEAFRRVPGSLQEPAGPPAAAQGGPPKPFPTGQASGLVPGQPQPPQQQVAVREPLRWTQVVAGAGAVAVAAWLAQAYLVPPMARWWRGKHQEPSPADKAAAAVAAAIQAQTAEMRATMEGMRAMLKSAEDAKSLQPEPVSLLELREELRGLALSLQAQQASTKEGTTKEETRLAGDMQELKMLVTALASNALKAQQSQQPSPDAPAFSRPAPRTNGYANGGSHGEAMRQQYGHNRSSSPSPSRASKPPQSPPAASGNPSYMDVLEMLEKGETPPGIRTDIQDSPPNPSQPPPPSSLAPRSKPWERNSSQPDEPDKGPWKPPSAPAPSIFVQGGSRPSSTAGSDIAGGS